MKPRITGLAILLCLVIVMTFPATAEETQSQIERAVVSYAAEGTRDEQALSGLASLDPALGEKWARIMDLWEAPVVVNDALPDDLPDDDSLCLLCTR